VTSAPGERARPSLPLLLAGAGFLVLVDVVRVALLRGPARTISMDGFEVFVAVLCTVASASAAARSSAFGRGRWALVAAFFFGTAVADVHDFVAGLLPGVDLLPQPFLVLGWGTYLPLALLVFFPVEEEGRRPWTWLAVLDFTQVALVLGVAYYDYVYLPHVASHLPWAIRSRPDEIRNAVLSVGLVLRAFVDPSPRARGFYRRVGGCFAAMTFFLVATGQATALDVLGRPACLLLLGVFAARWEDSSTAPVRARRPVLHRWLLGLLPSLGPVLVLLLVLAGPGAESRTPAVTIAVSVLIFVARTGLAEYARHAAAQRERLTEERYRLLFERNLAGVWRSTLDGRLLDCNDSFARIFGFESKEQVVAESAVVLYESSDHRKRFVAELLEKGHLKNHEERYRTRDGKVIYTIENVSLSGDLIEGTIFDVTERRVLEEELRQAQKMEAVGRLAGGVAHDFNNVLAVVQGYSELLAKQLAAGDEKVEQVSEIQKAAERAAALTRQLLAFSRKQVLQPRVLDLNEVLTDMEKMLRRLIGEHIEVDVDGGPGLWSVQADPGQLEQIVLNLALNARDSMPQGGRLTLETRNVKVGEDTAVGAGLSPGAYVKLAVRDTGTGMDAEVVKHIFEPFFTTKELGKGTGLGLATVYGVVRQSGGHITVLSEPGKGSTFEIYLPRALARAEPREAAPAPALGGSETILLVEDEDSLRTMVRDLLGAGGYTVLDTRSGADALRIAGSRESPIHLLLTDVVMPQMSGPELATAVRACRPGIKVVYMSGYSDEAIARHGILDPGTVLLSKPFTAHALARRVAEALASEAQTPASA
jgi:PAS domain S-box-containing protein